MPSPHVATLEHAEPLYRGDLGSLTALTSATLPILNGLSLSRTVLSPGGIRAPQWHANANQLAYVLSGTVLVSILGNVDRVSRFVARAGEMFHVTSGSIHHIENVGDDDAEIIAAVRSDRPESFLLADGFAAMTDAVLGNTFDLPASAFAAFGRGRGSAIVHRDGAAEVPDGVGLPNAALFDVEGQIAPLQYPYGSAKLARKQYWAALEDLSMYSLRIGGDGMREPHWHPVTAEMGYVASGRGRMTVLNPDLGLDTYELQPGQVYFIPRAYPHHIEALDDDGLHFLIFFDQPTPGDIGIKATASMFSREVLSAAFEVPERDLPVFPDTPIDPLIVPRSNPRD